MVYESFFESKLWQVKTGLGKEYRFFGLLMRIGANALDQSVGIPYYARGFRPFSDADLDINTGIDLITDAAMDTNSEQNTKRVPAQNWLIWHLHDCLLMQMGTEKVERHMRRLARLAWEEKNKTAHISYLLPFLAYYETRWNERKGYGELAALVKEYTSGSEAGNAFLGSRMSAMIQCYGEITEEAYDQREIFSGLLRRYTQAYLNNLTPQTANSSQDSVQAAYALMKGIRLGVLHQERYAEAAKAILTAMESEGFVYQDGMVRFKEEEGVKQYEKAMYCMMAYGEYIKLRKERPYYGI